MKNRSKLGAGLSIGIVSLASLVSGCSTLKKDSPYIPKQDAGCSVKAYHSGYTIRLNLRDLDFIDRVEIYNTMSKQTEIIEPEKETVRLNHSLYAPGKINVSIVKVNDKRDNLTGHKIVLMDGTISSSDMPYNKKGHNCLK